MPKLCLIFNIASHYRLAIYTMIEHNYDCDWYFGDNKSDIKELSLSVFKNHYVLHTYKIGNTKLLYRKGLASLISDKRYDNYLMTGEIWDLSVWIFLIKAKLFYPQKKIYLWSHGWYGKESYLQRCIKKFFYSLVNGIFVYGNYAKDLMVSEGIDNKKLFVIHNSLQYDDHMALLHSLFPSDIFKNHFQNTNKNLIFIGRLTKIKRLDYLIQALEILKKRGTNVNLTLLGTGPMIDDLKQMVSKNSLTDSVWFYGASYDEKVNSEFLYNADLCVSPGNVGLTAIHSMTFGTPVLTHSSFHFQMPEFEAIKPGITGDFFKKDDVMSLVDCIQNWLSVHSTDRQTVREACCQEIKEGWTPEYQFNVLKDNLTF